MVRTTFYFVSLTFSVFVRWFICDSSYLVLGCVQSTVNIHIAIRTTARSMHNRSKHLLSSQIISYVCTKPTEYGIYIEFEPSAPICYAHTKYSIGLDLVWFSFRVLMFSDSMLFIQVHAYRMYSTVCLVFVVGFFYRSL